MTPVAPPERAGSHDAAARVERRWSLVSVGIVVLLVFLASFAGVHQAVMPQSRMETADPRTLHISGEFIESNLGSAVEPDGSVTVRVIGQQYSFTPQCIVVPTDTPITIRATSADVIHGFLIEHTNINTMLIPGYIATLNTRFTTPAERYMPCHEYCGMGHQGMWARVQIIKKPAFMRLAANSRRLNCVAQ
jgi:cytochrome c oxidase subunit II